MSGLVECYDTLVVESDASALSKLRVKPVEIIVHGVGHAGYVRVLKFNNMSLYQIPRIDGFPHLTGLSLAGNKISKIENLEHLSNLIVLDLSENRLTSMDGLQNLINLRSLDLSDNRITQIPEWIWIFQRAELVYFDKNSIMDDINLEKLYILNEDIHITIENNPFAGEFSTADEYLSVKKKTGFRRVVS